MRKGRLRASLSFLCQFPSQTSPFSHPDALRFPCTMRKEGRFGQGSLFESTDSAAFVIRRWILGRESTSRVKCAYGNCANVVTLCGGSEYVKVLFATETALNCIKCLLELV